MQTMYKLGIYYKYKVTMYYLNFRSFKKLGFS